MGNATRGDMAYALFDAMGLQQPTRTDQFSDAGYLAGITSTLYDLGITNGINDTEFGTTRGLTRGEAFTMIARSLGLADNRTSIEEASRRLVEAGIVRGYNNDPTQLGLGDPVTTDQIGLLMGRIQPMWDEPDPRRTDGVSLRDSIAERTTTAITDNLASRDPRFAAFLQASGVAEANLRDEMQIRSDTFGLDTTRRTETFARRADDARKGISTDFENRGLFRSGTRGQRILNSNDAIEEARRHEQERAREAHERGMRELGRGLDDVLGERAIAESEGRVREGEYSITERYA